MKRYSIFTVVNLIFFLSAFSQQEIYFNTTKSEDIKVESMHGLETHFSFFPEESVIGHLSSPDYYEPALYIGYFSEKRIADSWTIYTTLGLQNVASRRVIWQKNPTTGNLFSNINNYNIGYDLLVELGIEPRWYWGYKSRYQLGKAGLNSGWFLSIPITIQTPLLHSPDPIIDPGWLPSWFNGYAYIVPTVGYRQSISKRWFIEGSFGLGTNTIFDINYSSHKFEMSSLFIVPQLKLKAAYTFK